jgi:hypothetical protein
MHRARDPHPPAESRFFHFALCITAFSPVASAFGNILLEPFWLYKFENLTAATDGDIMIQGELHSLKVRVYQKQYPYFQTNIYRDLLKMNGNGKATK